jgi:hypothetical protein
VIHNAVTWGDTPSLHCEASPPSSKDGGTDGHEEDKKEEEEKVAM